MPVVIVIIVAVAITVAYVVVVVVVVIAIVVAIVIAVTIPSPLLCLFDCCISAAATGVTVVISLPAPPLCADMSQFTQADTTLTWCLTSRHGAMLPTWSMSCRATLHQHVDKSVILGGKNPQHDADISSQATTQPSGIHAQIVWCLAPPPPPCFGMPRVEEALNPTVNAAFLSLLPLTPPPSTRRLNGACHASRAHHACGWLQSHANGRKISAMPPLWYAGESLLPMTLHFMRMPDRGEAEAAMGGGSQISLCPLSAVFHPWGSIGMSGGL